ncbi:unnamed protein product [Darwinula stevensoni]|uniref:Uncharacterized protein n=1 Tax=Darwinula stevensoni TaxID=69355 RepID=A0A7R9A3S4_9CRUS|nr:unnamed protein product [Darwinula stevensoni]CAG0891193.1 unnamed protein product [Darwinula stevensoni]
MADVVANILAQYSDELQFINFEVILVDLRVKGIIKHHEYFGIVYKGTREKLLFLQEHLPHRGDDAFPTFLEILRHRNHAKLADTLDNEVDGPVLITDEDRESCHQEKERRRQDEGESHPKEQEGERRHEDEEGVGLHDEASFGKPSVYLTSLRVNISPAILEKKRSGNLEAEELGGEDSSLIAMARR